MRTEIVVGTQFQSRISGFMYEVASISEDGIASCMILGDAPLVEKLRPSHMPVCGIEGLLEAKRFFLVQDGCTTITLRNLSPDTLRTLYGKLQETARMTELLDDLTEIRNVLYGIARELDTREDATTNQEELI